MRIILSDPTKSGLEGDAWIDGQRQKHYHYEIYESVIFFRAVYHSTTHVISHPVIAAIFDVILNS